MEFITSSLDQVFPFIVMIIRLIIITYVKPKVPVLGMFWLVIKIYTRPKVVNLSGFWLIIENCMEPEMEIMGEGNNETREKIQSFLQG